MKKIVLALLMLGMTAQISAQNSRSAKITVQASIPDTAGIEAISDTTSAGSSGTTVFVGSGNIDNCVNTGELTKHVVDELLKGDLLFTLFVLVILFVLAPVLILTIIFYFIYRNRKLKAQVAEAALRSGQPIPEQVKVNKVPADDTLMAIGVRRLFLGLGLTVLFVWMDINIGAGIGALIALKGVGEIVIAKRL